MCKLKKLHVVLCLSLMFLTGCGTTPDTSGQDSSQVTTEGVLMTEQFADMSQQQSYIEKVKQDITSYVLYEEQQQRYNTLVGEYEDAIAERNVQLCIDKENEFTELFKELENEKAWNDAKMKNQYAGILRRAYYEVVGFYPTTEDIGNDEIDDFADKYAIYDIDLDGKEELLISITSSTAAGMSEAIYDYDFNSNELISQLSEFPLTTYYDNGVITAGWSHNQGLGPDFTPYDLYQYDTQQDTYIMVGSVDTWDKKYFPVDRWTDTIFPDELDTDGDGVIYSIRMRDEDEENWYDNDAYEEWLQSYVGTANKIDIPWQSIHSEEWQNYASNYIDMVVERRKNALSDEETDVGVSFLESEAYTDVVVDELSQRFNFRLEQAEYSDMVEYGYIDDQLVLEIYNEGSASIYYSDIAVPNLTMFGIYPGMSLAEAVVILEQYGFNQKDEFYYCTGDDHGNYMISLDTEADVVKKIYIYQFSMFAG